MDNVQTWTLIATFGTVMLGTMTILTTSLNRTIRAEISGLRGELGGEISGLRAEMNARFDTVDSRFDAMQKQIDHLDRDVNGIIKRQWGLPEAD